MPVDVAVLHRYAVAIPNRVQLEAEQNWYQVAQVAIVVATAFLSAFALTYSAFVLESSIVGVCSIVVILAGATQLWEYCNEWVRKHRKAIEIATIFESLQPQDYNGDVHQILSARALYFEKSFTTFNQNIEALKKRKEDFINSEAAESNTYEYSQQILEFNAQIHEQKKLAAIARIKIAWLNVLIEQPDFEGDLSDLCYYCENEKYQDYCINLVLAKEVDNADAFLFFKNEEEPLRLDDVLETDLDALRNKLYHEPTLSESTEKEKDEYSEEDRGHGSVQLSEL